MQDAEILEAQEGYVFGGFGDVFIVVWRRTTTVATTSRMGQVVERFAARHKGGIAMIVVIESTCEMPDGPTRDVMARDMKRHESFTKQMLLVYEGTGFRAAAIRSVVIGLQMLSRQVVDTKTVATVSEAVRWLATRRSTNAAELETAIETIRKAKSAAFT